MNCGTRQGMERHKSLNEPPCKWCVKAVTDPAPVIRKKPGPKAKPKTVAQKQQPDRVRYRARYEGEIEHGTPWGYQQHKARGDADCEPCRVAANARRKMMRDERKARELLAAT